AADAALSCALLSGECCQRPRSLITVLAEISPPLTRPVGRGGRNSTGRDDAEARSKLPAGCWAGRAAGAAVTGAGAAATAAGRSGDFSLAFGSLALAAGFFASAGRAGRARAGRGSASSSFPPPPASLAKGLGKRAEATLVSVLREATAVIGPLIGPLAITLASSASGIRGQCRTLPVSRCTKFDDG